MRFKKKISKHKENSDTVNKELDEDPVDNKEEVEDGFQLVDRPVVKSFQLIL